MVTLVAEPFYLYILLVVASALAFWGATRSYVHTLVCVAVMGLFMSLAGQGLPRNCDAYAAAEPRVLWYQVKRGDWIVLMLQRAGGGLPFYCYIPYRKADGRAIARAGNMAMRSEVPMKLKKRDREHNPEEEPRFNYELEFPEDNPSKDPEEEEPSRRTHRGF